MNKERKENKDMELFKINRGGHISIVSEQPTSSTSLTAKIEKQIDTLTSEVSGVSNQPKPKPLLVVNPYKPDKTVEQDNITWNDALSLCCCLGATFGP